MHSVKWWREAPATDRIVLVWLGALLLWLFLADRIFNEQVSVIGVWVLAGPIVAGVALLFLQCVWVTIQHMRKR